MERYNHQVGLKIVGECLPQKRNGVTLMDERDQYGLRIPRVTYSYCDNDQRLIRHSLRFMREALEVVGATELWDETDDTCHLNGTARMGSSSWGQRGQRGLPLLGCPQSLDLRRVGIPYRRGRESIADHPGDRLPNGRQDRSSGDARGTVSSTAASQPPDACT
jgi:hypothetical protein